MKVLIGVVFTILFYETVGSYFQLVDLGFSCHSTTDLERLGSCVTVRYLSLCVEGAYLVAALHRPQVPFIVKKFAPLLFFFVFIEFCQWSSIPAFFDSDSFLYGLLTTARRVLGLGLFAQAFYEYKTIPS